MGLAKPARAAESRHGVSFDDSYDVVDDLGFDNSGNSAIDGKLRQYVRDDTLLKFPPGEYLITSKVAHWGLDNFGIVGTGDSRNDVEFVFPSGYEGEAFGFRKGRNWVFENFTVQQSDDDDTGALCVFSANDNLNVHNVETAGFSPRNVGSGINVYIWDDDGEGVIEGYVNRDGGAVGDYPSASPGIFSGPGHDGVLYIRDVHIEEVGSSGIYASRPDGDVRVEGGFFKNNDIAAIRVAGDGSYVKDATIVIDTENTNNISGTYYNTRGVWWESGQTAKSGGSIENCEFAMLSTNRSGGLLHIASTVGDVAVRNCRFKNETRNAIIQGTPAKSGTGGGAVDISNVSIVGSSYRPWRAAIELHGRPGTSITDTCIQCSSEGGTDVREGILLDDCGNATIQNCTINVPGEPIVLNGTSADPSGISESGSCPAPTLDSNGSSGYDGGGDDSDEESTDDGSESDEDDSNTDESSGADGGSTGNLDGAELTIKSNGGRASYEFTVSGDIESNPSKGGADFIRGDSARGAVAGGGRDGYVVTGTVESFSADDGATVYLDGSEVAPDDVAGSGGSSASTSGSGDSSTESGGSEDSSGTSSTESGGSEDSSGDSSGSSSASGESTLTVQSNGGRASYEFTVSGDIESNPSKGGADFVRGDSARGTVGGGGRDGYVVTGTVESFSADDGATVYLDGQEVAPGDVAGSSTASDGGTEETGSKDDEQSDGSAQSDESSSGSGSTNEQVPLTIKSKGGTANYEFTVSGDVESNPDRGSSDFIRGQTAWGAVGGHGRDGYFVSGTIESFSADDGATVYLDGQEVAPGDLDGGSASNLGQRSVTLSSTTSDEKQYRLRVSDQIDDVASDTVTGTLRGGSTTLSFSGELLGIDVDDPDAVDVKLDGQERPAAGL